MLGPLEITDGGSRVDPGGPQPRRLTEALVAAHGVPVSEGRLAEAVWGGRPPANPSASLQAYVPRLRKAFGAGALTRGPGGYALAAGSDAADFRSGVERGLAAARPRHALHAFATVFPVYAVSMHQYLPRPLCPGTRARRGARTRADRVAARPGDRVRVRHAGPADRPGRGRVRCGARRRSAGAAPLRVVQQVDERDRRSAWPRSCSPGGGWCAPT
ncbi:hypothetical protein JCM9534A_39590 [Catenuloplanes indicus JCM 9534]